MPVSMDVNANVEPEIAGMMEAISSIGSPGDRKKKKIITRRSTTMGDLLNNWSDRVKKAEEEWELEGLNNGVDHGLSNILSTLDKKSSLNGNSKSDEMSSLETRATHSDSNEQPRARYQYQYEQRPLYNDNPKPKRSHSAGRYSDHSGHVGDDDYVRVAETRSSEQYRYETSYAGRGDQESGGRAYHDVSQPFNSSYQHYPRDEEAMALKDSEQYWVPSSYVSPSTQSPYQPGPPKPPRRQQSLNRIHIPSGPDYDEDSKSPTEVELSSTSPESGSPKHWQTSPLVDHQRGFAIIGSPSKHSQNVSREVGYPSQQAVQTSSVMTSSNHSQREYSHSYAKQQSYTMQERDERRSQAQYKSTPTSPQRQPNIIRQSSLPVSHSPQSLPRQQNVQRAASFDRQAGNTRRDDAPTRSHTVSHSPQRYSSKAKREQDSPPRRSDPKSRASRDRQGSRSVGRPAQPARNQPRHPPVDSRRRKTSSPERGVTVLPKDAARRGSFPVAHIERFIVPDKQTESYASPQYQTTPAKPLSAPPKAKQGGLGALLVSDKDHEPVNIDSVSWLLENSNFSKPEYISDSGVSSIRDGPLGPQAQTYVAPVQTALTPSMDYSFPTKPQAHFPEETAQYRLYGDGPLEFPSYGNDREKILFSKPVTFEKHQPEDYYSKQSPASYTPSPADKKLQEHISRRDQHRQFLRSTSQQSPEREWKTQKDQEQRWQHFPQTDTVDPRVGSSSYYPSSQQKSTRNSSQQQDSTLNRSPKKALFKADNPNWAQYRAEEIKPMVEAGHYDYPKKYYPVQDSPTSGSSYDQHDLYNRPLANGQTQRIKASPNRYNKKVVEADRMGIEPAMDGGEAYWGMESRKPAPNRLANSQRTPEPVSEYRSTLEASVDGRKETSIYYNRDNTQAVSAMSSKIFQESEIKRQKESLNQTSPPGERQSRYDRLKQRVGGQQNSQNLSGVKNFQPRSKSLSRLDSREKVPQSSKISSNKDMMSKSTDDLDDLRKKGFSRGAALFMRMMRQASMEEGDYELQSIDPVAVDSYIGTARLFQPQVTKTGEPILDLASPGSDSFAKVPPSMEEESLVTMEVQRKVNSSPPKGKISEFGEVPTTHWRDRVQTERQNEQKQTKEQRNGIVDTKPIPSPDGPPPVVTTRHGNQEVPVEWLLKHEGLRRTSVGGKRSASPSKYSHLTERSPSPTKRTPLVEKSLSFTKKEEVLERTSVAKQLSSPKKQELNRTSSVEKSVPPYTKQDVLNRTSSPKQAYSPVKQGPKGISSDEKHHVTATKEEVVNRTPFSEKGKFSSTGRSPSPIKLKSPDSEPIPLSRRGKQDVPSEWLKVLDRLHGKPKERSSDGGLPASKSKPEKSHRVSADFEDALSELEHMYSILDEEADDLMFHKSRRPFDQRISELPPALQKRLKDLKEYAISQRNKRQARRERAKTDITAKTQGLISHKPAAELKKNEEFASYKQSLNSSSKLSKPTTLDLPIKANDLRHRAEAARTERSSSDEEASPQQRNSAKLYRQPRSADNLGFSSDSSPSPDRNRKNFASRFEAASRKPESRFERVTGLVLPEYVPSHKRQVEKTHTLDKDPVEAQSPKTKATPKQGQEFISKTTAVDVRENPSIFEKLDAGSRMSMDSVSTVDSYQLSQPFEEISAEYHKISSDHRMDIVSDDDVSPDQRSSSMESLVQSVANSGNGLKRRSKQKKGKEASADGELRTGEKSKSTGSGPVPLATFDEEIDQRPSAFADILHLLSWIDSTDI